MPVKILMVCLGNICRSPLAEGILASKLPKDVFFVDSAGTGNYHIDKQPDKRSITTAQKNGLDISKQKARQFSVKDFDAFDYIFAMDTNNYEDILSLAKNENQAKKVDLILNQLFPNENVDVPDPYYEDMAAFEEVYQIVYRCGENFLAYLVEKHGL